MGEKAEPQSAGEAIEAGHIEFVMHGERLRGKFALIRMKARGRAKPQWLLIKMKDEFARDEPGEESAAPKAQRPKAAAAPTKTSRSSKAPKGKVELTHPDRV